MITIAKPRRVRYYLNQVARGAEDYCAGAGEAPGRWIGALAAEMGLVGPVSEEDLGAAMQGRNPIDGTPLLDTSTPGRRVGAFDLVCSAPKGVSLLEALSEPATAATVRAAHDQAVAEALAYLEAHASFVRRGHNGAGQRLEGTGLMAAAFRHRTSRAAEPQLHTHLLVINVAKGTDGRRSALDGRSIYAQCRAAGFVYQAALRAQLSGRLGIGWNPVINGMAEPAGMDPAVLKAFSSRRAQILAGMESAGFHSPAAAQIAACATRAPKHEITAEEAAAMHSLWARRAAFLGLSSEVLEALLGRPLPTGIEAADAASLASHLVGPDGLSAHRSVFERRDVVCAIAGAAPNGAALAQIEAMVDGVLGRAEVVAAGLNRLGEARWSTAALVALERAVIDGASQRLGAGVGLVAEEIVESVLSERPMLSDQQRDMVRILCTTGDGLAVVVGKAGSGKTTALEAAHAAWARAGHQVIGCALAGRTADELEAGSGIRSCTLASLLNDLASPQARLGPRSVIVIDEAGIVGSRDLARLLALAGPAKVVAVGDFRQLPEISAGGCFGALARGLGAIELSENRRQVHAWERAALDEMRHGHLPGAVAIFAEHKRITLAPSADGARSALLADWYQARITEPEQAALMIALRRDDVAYLNRMGRQLLRQAGPEVPETLISSLAFSVGDEVMGLRNDRRIGIRNGSRAVVQHINRADFSMGLRLLNGAEVVIPASYVQDGDLSHAYALTLHKAQGITTERAFLLGSEALYREAAYVGLSRARQRNDLYAVAAPDGPAGAEPYTALVTRLARSQAQVLASDGTPNRLDRLGPERDALLGVLGRGAGPAVDAEQVLAGIDAEVSRLRAGLGGASGAAATLRLEALETERAALVATMGQALADQAATGDRREHLGRLNQAIAARVDALGQAATLAAPEVVSEVLGPVPDGLSPRGLWRSGAEAILAYRERWGIEGAATFGGPPRSAIQQAERAGAERALAAATRQLGLEANLGMGIG